MDVVGWVFLIIVCGVMPVLAIQSAAAARKAPPALSEVVTSAVVVQAVLVALAIWAAARNGLELFPAPSFTWRGALAGAALVPAVLVISAVRWHFKSPEERDKLAWLGPKRVGDMGLWLVISLAAGFAEEVIYRGALFGLVQAWVGWEWWLAAGFCVLAFALGHWVQGWDAMALIVAVAFAFHGLVWLTGDLYTAMVTHATYDFAAGWLILWLREKGAQAPAAGK